MRPLISKVPKQAKLICTARSQSNGYLCMESRGSYWGTKYSSEMLVIVIFLIWGLVTQMHSLCINCSDCSLLICVLLYIHIVLQKYLLGASLVTQWLRICLPMQGTWVQALVWEDPTCHGATRPVSHNYWAWASGACVLQQERPQ